MYMIERIKMIELFDFIDKNIKQGYNIYSDTKDINTLIDIIVNWYQTKYPKYIIQMSVESYNKDKSIIVPAEYDIRKTESLSKYMNYYELMLRIPSNLHSIIECWYKSNKDECLGNSFKIYFCPKNSLNEATTGVFINKYDGYLSLSTSILLDKIVKNSCTTIEQLIDKNNYFKKVDYDEIDFNDPKKVIETHNLDLEIRNKIFNLIAIRLLYSSKDKKVGYIRAKLFIKEFNKYIYNLNLQSTEIDQIVSNMNISEIADYVMKDIIKDNSDDIPVDEFGLTFEGLKNLKRKGMNKISNLIRGISPSTMEIDFYSSNCSRDEYIINKMKKQARANLSYKIALSVDSVTEKRIELSENKSIIKKKTIFGRNKKN